MQKAVSAGKRWVGSRWLQVGVALLLLAFLVSLLDGRRLLELWATTPWWRACAVLFLGGVGIGVQWIKWGLLVQAYAPGMGQRAIGRSLFGGFALGLFSPGRLGELGRGFFLPGEKTAYAALATVDRLLSFAITALLGVVGGWVSGVLTFEFIVVAAAVGGVVGGVVWRWGWPYLENKLAPLKACRGLGAGVWERAAFFSFLFNVVFCGQFILLARGWGDLPWAACGGVPLIYTLKALLPLSFLELGVREGAAVWVFSRLGLDPAIAFSAALGVFACNVLLPGGIGLFWVGSIGRRGE